MQFSAGKAAVTNSNDKIVITPNGTTATAQAAAMTASIATGDAFKILNEKATYNITTVDVSSLADLHIHISPAYAGTTATGQSFLIHRGWTSNCFFPEIDRADVNWAQIMTLKLIRRLDQYLAGALSMPGLKTSGRAYLNSPASSPATASLASGSISFYLDEGTNKLKVFVKYADGVTVKSGEVSLA